MGSCLSKKESSSSKVAVSATAPDLNKPVSNPKPQVETEVKAKKNPAVRREEKEVKEEEQEEQQNTVKKEIFVIKHRKSHERQPKVAVAAAADGIASTSTTTTTTTTTTSTTTSTSSGADPEMGKSNVASNINFIINGTAAAATPAGGAVRTSSCTKEEVDAILIQCGRLSRSSSGRATSNSGEQRSRKYSGSKRSYDFDHSGDNDALAADDNDYGGDDDGAAERRLHRQRNRQSRSSPQGRRTPSREREQQQQRSNSRERSSGGGSGSRRVSRSPGRRSENTSGNSGGGAAPAVNGNVGGTNSTSRPGKMVSVPATVSSLVMDKSNNGGEPATTTAIKRINVKRNVGGEAGTRSTASPRARSPARTHSNASNENPRARSPARANANASNENPRARSPARTNANAGTENQQQPLSRSSSRRAEQSPYRRNPLSEIDPNSLAYPQPNKAAQTKIKSKEIEADVQVPMQKPNVAQGANQKTSSRGTAKEQQQQQIQEEVKGQQAQMTRNVTVTAVPQTLTRSRSSRRSQDLDLNPETLLNPNPSYTSLLLEDIQNFHQKNTPTPTSFSLPPCVTKACSIVEAVADLNSCTSSNLSTTFSEYNTSSATNLAGKKRPQPKDPFVESEVIVNDDLMEPSLHKYVTVRRGGNGTLGGGEIEEEESSGSNSFVGGGCGQQHWGISSSSWEPNSADSTDRWTSRSNSREDDHSPLGIQRCAISETGREMEEARRGFSGKRRDYDHQQTGIGRGRVGGNKGPLAVAVAAST